MAADRPVSGKVVTLVESGQWSVSEEFRGVTVQLFGSIRSSQWTPVLALFVLETWRLTWSLGGTERLRTDILSLCLILFHPGFC